MTGTVVGYDPGGNGKHGVAQATVRDGVIECVITRTLDRVEDVIEWVTCAETLLGLGVDTLTCWGTGSSGWRPADRWLRGRYPEVVGSVLAPNSLHGSMSVNGMALLVTVRRAFPDIFVTETHPKVLYHALCKKCYAFEGPNESVMNGCLGRLLGVEVVPENEHEWDAAISILPVVLRLQGSLLRDLHALPTCADEGLVHPCGQTAYMWPDERQACRSADCPEP